MIFFSQIYNKLPRYIFLGLYFSIVKRNFRLTSTYNSFYHCNYFLIVNYSQLIAGLLHYHSTLYTHRGIRLCMIFSFSILLECDSAIFSLQFTFLLYEWTKRWFSQKKWNTFDFIKNTSLSKLYSLAIVVYVRLPRRFTLLQLLSLKKIILFSRHQLLESKFSCFCDIVIKKRKIVDLKNFHNFL